MRTTFYDLDLLTSPGRVFIPRAATEHLVDAALERIDGKPVRVADVGTGTGAVAVALAVNRPEIEVWATDTSEAAVELARANAERHGVGSRVHALRSLRVALYRARLDVREASLMRAAFIEVRKFLRRKGVLSEVGPVGVHRPAHLTGPGGSGTLNSGPAELDTPQPPDCA